MGKKCQLRAGSKPSLVEDTSLSGKGTTAMNYSLCSKNCVLGIHRAMMSEKGGRH